MYVLVHHDIRDPQQFWSLVDSVLDMPSGLKLHQTLSARDGTMATCLWEADSVEDVRNFLEPQVGPMSRNVYAVAENRDGIAVPTEIGTAAQR